MHEITELTIIVLAWILIYRNIFPKTETTSFKTLTMKNPPEPPKESHIIKYDESVQRLDTTLAAYVKNMNKINSKKAKLKLKCFKIVSEEHKGENRSLEFLTKKTNGLSNLLSR